MKALEVNDFLKLNLKFLQPHIYITTKLDKLKHFLHMYTLKKSLHLEKFDPSRPL